VVTGGDLIRLAERELAAFIRVVTDLFGPEQAQQSAEDWLRELVARDDLPDSSREWRTLTIAAATRLASRLNASTLSIAGFGATPI
jgi:alkylhydroperoxidase/carboxymuconolactone decarboxylase family protein YurZ